jgi:putative redox protein
MPAERFDFHNSKGLQLAALLDRPEVPPRAVALFAHCFTCGKHNRAARRIAEGLKQCGIAVLRFDFTGLGASEGDSPTPRSRPTSTISSPPRTTCGRSLPPPRS